MKTTNFESHYEVAQSFVRFFKGSLFNFNICFSNKEQSSIVFVNNT